MLTEHPICSFQGCQTAQYTTGYSLGSQSSAVFGVDPTYGGIIITYRAKSADDGR